MIKKAGAFVAATLLANLAAAHGGHGAPPLHLHNAEVLGLAALATMAVQMLGAWSAGSAAMRPLWTLLHAAMLSLGLWMLLLGRMPLWLGTLGRKVASGARPLAPGNGAAVAVAIPRSRQAVPLRQAALGLGWVLLPCGLLQTALMTAAMANSPMAGAAAMLAFTATSGLGLWAGPWLWRRLGAWGASPAQALRIAGLCIVAASLWVLAGGALHRFAAWCGL